MLESDSRTIVSENKLKVHSQVRSTSPARREVVFTPPSAETLQGVWRVTHSTLPMWKHNRNVTITYSFLNDPPGAIDDTVRYQSYTSDKQKQVRGIDTPDAKHQARYTWRGKGWLKIASSRWQVLGCGEEEGGWAVTFFEKTLFTPAGIDVYARTPRGLSATLLEEIKEEIRRLDQSKFPIRAEQLFEIRHD